LALAGGLRPRMALGTHQAKGLHLQQLDSREPDRFQRVTPQEGSEIGTWESLIGLPSGIEHAHALVTDATSEAAVRPAKARPVPSTGADLARPDVPRGAGGTCSMTCRSAWLQRRTAIFHRSGSRPGSRHSRGFRALGRPAGQPALDSQHHHYALARYHVHNLSATPRAWVPKGEFRQ
jgi:hypothetical protein